MENKYLLHVHRFLLPFFVPRRRYPYETALQNAVNESPLSFSIFFFLDLRFHISELVSWNHRASVYNKSVLTLLTLSRSRSRCLSHATDRLSLQTEKSTGVDWSSEITLNISLVPNLLSSHHDVFRIILLSPHYPALLSSYFSTAG